MSTRAAGDPVSENALPNEHQGLVPKPIGHQLIPSRTWGIWGVRSVLGVLRVLLLHIPGVMDGIVDHITGESVNAEGRPVTSTAGSKPGRTRHSVER